MQHPCVSGATRKTGAGRRALDIQRKDWCCQTGLNCRPLHYQWSALPLSYGSVPGPSGSAKKASIGGLILATRLPRAQAGGRRAVRSKIAGNERDTVANAFILRELRPDSTSDSTRSPAGFGGRIVISRNPVIYQSIAGHSRTGLQ